MTATTGRDRAGLDLPRAPRRRAMLARPRALGAALAALALLGACTSSPSTDAGPPLTGEATTVAPSPTAPAGPAQDGTAQDGTTPDDPAQEDLAREVPVRSSSLDDQAAGVASPRPVAVELARLGAQADVEPVGVAHDGQMEIPEYAETAGWYRFGAAPGDPQGTVVIAAHVDSIASGGVGPFAALRDAERGDDIEVTLEDGSTTTYVVTDVERRGKTGIDWEEVFVRDGEPRLVLVTCGGRFLRDVGHYEDNVLVWAQPRAARP